jgi:hypothetical protein
MPKSQNFYLSSKIVKPNRIFFSSAPKRLAFEEKFDLNIYIYPNPLAAFLTMMSHLKYSHLYAVI